MAFTNPIWEVKTTGDDTNNGGGFCAASVVSFPTDGAATVATTAAPIFSSASYNFVSTDIGHYVFIRAGTNWLPGWYKITAVSANKATLDATLGHVVTYISGGSSAVGLIPVTTGCASVASPTNATWGLDYSQKSDGTAPFTFTDMVIGATTTQFTSVGTPVGKNFLGNVISVTSGTGFTVQRVCVVTTTGTTATCDKTLGTTGSTGGNGKLGGALASVGLAGSLVGTLTGTCTFINSGSYNISSATANISGGCFSQTSGYCRLEGYNTYRGDLGTAPVLTATGSIATFTVITQTGVTTSQTRNLTVDCSSYTSARAFRYDSSIILKCTAKNCTNGGLSGGTSSSNVINCSATGCSTVSPFTFASGSGVLYFFMGCSAYANSVTGFIHNNSTFLFCISANNTGATSDGFQAPTTGNAFINCTAYGNGRHGFNHNNAPTSGTFLLNCVSEGHAAGWGYTSSTGVNLDADLRYCASYNNSSGGIDYTTMADTVIGEIAYSSSAFTNPAANDFSLNAVAGGGLSLRGTGLPGAYLNSMGTTGYIDIGAVQSPQAAAGFGEHAFPLIS